jgi:hypothetical protein
MSSLVKASLGLQLTVLLAAVQNKHLYTQHYSTTNRKTKLSIYVLRFPKYKSINGPFETYTIIQFNYSDEFKFN